MHSKYAGDLDTVLSLLGPDIISGAFTHLDRIGAGGTATVFSHPAQDDLVVRVTDYPDGWFSYAYNVLCDPVSALHGPRLLAMQYVDGIWIALAERLQELPDTLETYALLGCARRIIDPISHGEASDADIDMMMEQQPGFMDFCENHLFGARDLTDQNFMQSNGTLVVNDPYRSMTPFWEKNLAQIYAGMLREAA